MTVEDRVTLLTALADLSPAHARRFTAEEIEFLALNGERELANKLWREWNQRQRRHG